MSGDYQLFVTSALYSIRLFSAHLNEVVAISGLIALGCFICRFFIGFYQCFQLFPHAVILSGTFSFDFRRDFLLYLIYSF